MENFRPAIPMPEPAAADGRSGTYDDSYSVLNDFWADIHANLFAPASFFTPENMLTRKHPGIFLFLVVLAASFISGFWDRGFFILRQFYHMSGAREFHLLGELVLKPLSCTLAIMLGVRIMAAVMHLGLRMTGRLGGDAGLTYRVFCYAAAAALFSFIPLIGPALAWGWGIVLLLVGLRAAQGAGWFRLAISTVLSAMFLIIIVIAPVVTTISFLVIMVAVIPGLLL